MSTEDGKRQEALDFEPHNGFSLRLFFLLSFSSVFLQKLGLTFGDASIGINFIILWLVMGYLFVAGIATIPIERAVAFVLMIGCMLLSMFLSENTNLFSFAIVPLAFGPLLFRVDVSLQQAYQAFKMFQRSMLIISIVIISQQISQQTVGNWTWINLDRLIPSSLLIGGYAYIRPIHWGSSELTPNGTFFLEPSIASYYLGTATLIEIIFLRRFFHLIILFLAILSSMAGTGLAMLALGAPLLLFTRISRRSFYVFMAIMPILFVFYSAGLFDRVVSRVGEFGDPSKSAYARFYVPLKNTQELLFNSDYLLTGQGAGASAKGNDQVQWPTNKFLFEYGFLSSAAFFVFLFVASLTSPPSVPLALAILIPYMFFGGGVVSHTSIMLLVMFCSLFHIRLPYLNRKPDRK